jgi:hypothetical protein
MSQRKPRTWPTRERLFVAAVATALFVLPVAAQEQGDVSGVWVLDSGNVAGEVYGELRVVRKDSEAVRISMIDYGTAWIDGAFRGVLRVMPWTFRFDAWGPRRGAATSSQPKAMARRVGSSIVLCKLTERGNGDFVSLWTPSEDGRALIQRASARSCAESVAVKGVADAGLRFVRASTADDSPSSQGALLERLRSVVPVVGEITVRASADLSTLIVGCPTTDCRIVEFHSGIQTGARQLPRGTTATLVFGVEPRPGAGGVQELRDDRDLRSPRLKPST